MSFIKALKTKYVIQAKENVFLADSVVQKELEKLKEEFEKARNEGSPQFLEKLLSLAKKEKAIYDKERPSIEKKIEDLKNNHEMVREDLMLSALTTAPVKLKAEHDGSNKFTLTDAQGKSKGTVERANSNSNWKYTGNDEAIATKIQKSYNKKQYAQDLAKLRALDRYFDAAVKAIAHAIQVRDSKTPVKDKLINMGGEKLKGSKILAFNQLPGMTCPGKGDCFNWCFALSGQTAMTPKIMTYATNLGEAERDDFVPRINAQLKKMRPTNTEIDGEVWDKVVRIHAYGDFHSPTYVEKWRKIAKANDGHGDTPKVFFYAYTKSHYMKPMQQWMSEIESGKVKNVKIMQSYGGKFDHKIDDNKPHARVFDSVEQINDVNSSLPEGEKYFNCVNDDLDAAKPSNPKIAIVKHGKTVCSSSALCPMKKTTANYVAAMVPTKELPLLHSVDQIDLPYHMEEEEFEGIADPHMSANDHVADFRKYLPTIFK